MWVETVLAVNINVQIAGAAMICYCGILFVFRMWLLYLWLYLC